MIYKEFKIIGCRVWTSSIEVYISTEQKTLDALKKYCFYPQIFIHVYAARIKCKFEIFNPIDSEHVREHTLFGNFHSESDFVKFNLMK